MIKISIEGADEVLAAINQTITDLERGEVFEAAAQTHRMVLVPAAKAEAPVRTGELRDSIKTRIENGTLHLEASADHAGYVHDGTSKQAPNPFLDRAIARTNDDLQKRIGTELTKRFK